MRPKTQANVQRLVDEYLGAMGSAAIVSHDGDVLFRSAHDDSALELAPILRYVSRAQLQSLDPEVVSIPVDSATYGYGVALSDTHVLLVVTELGISANAATTRIKKAALLLGRVLSGRSQPTGGGESGAAAEVSLEVEDVPKSPIGRPRNS